MESDRALTQSLELMRRAQAGDRHALERLVERYYDRVRPIVRARLGARLRRRVTVSDILQNTFVAVVQCYENFEVRTEANLISWMARIAERQILDEYDRQTAMKRSAEREVPLEGEGGGEAVEKIGGGPGPEEEAALAEQQAALEESLAELPDLYRELILLRDYAGHSWQEIAEATGRPSPDAARMMHAQARVELAKRVQQRTEARRRGGQARSPSAPDASGRAG